MSSTERDAEPSTHSARRIVLITNLRTTNVGNEALSSEFVAVLEELFPADNVAVLGRGAVSRHPSRQVLEALRKQDLDGLVDRLTDNFLSYKESHDVKPAASQTKVTLERPEQRGWVGALRNLARALRLRRLTRQLAALRSRGEGYRRLRLLEDADLVIWNPAGELGAGSPTDYPVQQLLELAVAAKLGCRTVVANHTVEATDLEFQTIIAALYNRFDLIAVRDPLSRGTLMKFAADIERVTVIPDLAFLAQPRSTSPMTRRAIAVAINHLTVGISPDPWSRIGAFHRHDRGETRGRRTGLLEGWSNVVAHCQARGRDVVFVSNALVGDNLVGERLAKMSSRVTVAEPTSGYREYASLLGEFELVVSNRLHTCILALAAGTPVLPIEPSTHKMRGLFETFDYPVSVIDPREDPNWSNAAIDALDQLFDTRVELKQSIATELGRVRTKIREDLRRGLGSLLTR